MISPVPLKPAKVSLFAPSFPANHRISAHPCATRAAIALFPNSNPSTIPAAIANTFFNAPDISTPTTSVLVFTRKHELPYNDCTLLANISSSDAATIPVGNPCISSTANVGPLKMHNGWSLSKAAGMTSDIIRDDPTSKPFDKHNKGVLGSIISFTALKNFLECCVGTAWMMKSESFSASFAFVVARMFFGNTYLGKYFILRLVALIVSTSCSFLMSKTTSKSFLFLAKSVPMAVPNDPPPMMVTFFVFDSTSSSFTFALSTNDFHRMIFSHDSFTSFLSSSVIPERNCSYAPPAFARVARLASPRLLLDGSLVSSLRLVRRSATKTSSRAFPKAQRLSTIFDATREKTPHFRKDTNDDLPLPSFGERPTPASVVVKVVEVVVAIIIVDTKNAQQKFVVVLLSSSR